MSGCQRQVQFTLAAIIGTVLAITGAMFGKFVYEQLVQAPRCYSYAAEKQIPDADNLTFEDVVIATNMFHGHICHLRYGANGSPVTLEFDEADIPVFIDTVQVLVMVAAFLIAFFPTLILWPRDMLRGRVPE